MTSSVSGCPLRGSLTLPVGLTLLQNSESNASGWGILMAGAVAIIALVAYNAMQFGLIGLLGGISAGVFSGFDPETVPAKSAWLMCSNRLLAKAKSTLRQRTPPRCCATIWTEQTMRTGGPGSAEDYPAGRTIENVEPSGPLLASSRPSEVSAI